MSDKEFNSLKRMELAHFMGELNIITKCTDVFTLYLRDAAKRFTDDQLKEITDRLLAAFRVWSRPIVIDFTSRPPY